MKDPSREPGLSISQVFLSRVDFSHRPDALNLPPGTPVQPDSVEVEVGLMRTADGRAAAMNVLVSSGDDPEALYRFRLEMMAVVQVQPGEENMNPAEFLETVGVATLFPFVREAVANVTMRGRFGPVWLAPINVAVATEELRKAKYVDAGDTNATVQQPKTAKRRSARRASKRPKKDG